MKKLQNYFNVFLPQNYKVFRQSIHKLTSNQAVVAELLRLCAEGNDVKAIQIAFERVLGKPEKVVVIKRTMVRMVYPDALTRAKTPIINDQVVDEVQATTLFEDKVIIDEGNAPGVLLTKKLDKIGDLHRGYSYEVLEAKDNYDLAEVIVANLYAIGMAGGNLRAISMLFDYIDGAVADVIRLEGEDTILLENYADVAPYEAKQDDDGTWYVERETVK